MAPTRPSRGKRSVNSYDSDILRILVKGQSRPFNVHKSFIKAKSTLLAKLEVHGSDEHRRRSPTEMTIEGGDEEVKSEDAETVELQDNDYEEGSEQSSEVYSLLDTKTKADVFRVFVDFLYNKDPSPVTDAGDAKRAVRVYIFAVKYDALPLQNSIIDRLREYHQGCAFDLDLLILLINRLPDVSSNLCQYLIAQMAYDISENGYYDFAAVNTYLKTWIIEQDREVRLEVFKAIIDIAVAARKREKILDPSGMSGAHKCKWHVHEDGTKCNTAT